MLLNSNMLHGSYGGAFAQLDSAAIQDGSCATSEVECPLVAWLAWAGFSVKSRMLADLISYSNINLENSSWLYCIWFFPPNCAGSTSSSKYLPMSSKLSAFFGKTKHTFSKVLGSTKYLIICNGRIEQCEKKITKQRE